VFEGKAGAYPSETPFRCSTLGWLLALPTNIGLSLKGLPGVNTLAYYENFVTCAHKKFYNIGLSSGITININLISITYGITKFLLNNIKRWTTTPVLRQKWKPMYVKVSVLQTVANLRILSKQLCTVL
jgi:hypothetical protein